MLCLLQQQLLQWLGLLIKEQRYLTNDIFFEHLADISEKNLEINGQPELTYEQLELLRRTAKVIKIARTKYHYSDDGLFLFYENYPPISMN